jgi:hypothetical protein
MARSVQRLGYVLDDRETVQTDSGAHPVSMGRFFPPGVKKLKRKGDYSVYPVPNLRMRGAKPPIPHAPSLRGV